MNMYHFELRNTDTDEVIEISVPEEMSIEDFTREIRCEMGLQYTVGAKYHMIIDQQNRVFMQDDAIATHVDMLWEGGDAPNDPFKQAPQYREDFYYPESQYTLQDLFPEIGSDIFYGQDYDHICCTLIGITKDNPT